ncbi:MAG: DUF1963 domain-containing protein [Oscillospiraceae bacterium]|nr:DUF1963 domain-containing protein [Oscillospiraceae bacterium]
MLKALYKRYGIGVVFLAFAIVFIVFGIKNTDKNNESKPYYTTVNAVITEKHVSPAEEPDSFADVAYTDLSGVERRGRIAYNGPADVGDTIEIDMSTHNPAVIGFANAETEQRQRSEITKNKRYSAVEIVVGTIMAAVGIFLLMLHANSEKETQPETAERKTEVVEAVQKPENNYNIENILKKIDEKFPPKPVVKLEPKRAENLGVFESKLGGVPYMPLGFEYPKGKGGIFEGRPLRLLAQLNFEKLPHIENFPQKGILQFFCSDDEEDSAYGLNFDSPIEQNGFRIIYHENIIMDETMLMSKESMPKFKNNLGNFPFEGEFLLEAGMMEMCPITYEDYRFFDKVLKHLGEIAGKELKTLTEAEEAGFGDDFWEKLCNSRIYEQTCIGGYPFFTQDDPRGYKEEIANYDILLFQCASFFEGDTGDEIMWGDVGVANFFISESDLKNLDFSKVAYNWDCG